jgi:hypothetical protein
MLIALPESPSVADEIALEMPEHVLEEFRGRDRQGELRLMFTKRNAVALTPPVVRGFEGQVDPETRDRMHLPADGYELVVVLTTLDCRPDPDCHFTWVRVEVTGRPTSPACVPAVSGACGRPGFQGEGSRTERGAVPDRSGRDDSLGEGVPDEKHRGARGSVPRDDVRPVRPDTGLAFRWHRCRTQSGR